MMSTPLVSICLPTLNSVRFLERRIESIQNQTLTNWEVVCFDSYSTDGTMQRLEKWANEDSRINVFSSDPDGIYTNINRCIQKANGKYVYIATSDDDFDTNCLQLLAEALESHPECGIAHCSLNITDESDAPLEARNEQWKTTSTFSRSSLDSKNSRHVRKAPFDGMLHAMGSNVYISLTQILIRRELFDQIGYFKTDWGSIGDFAWEMRASLATDTIHVVGTKAGWRIHSSQATHTVQFKSSQHREKIRSMIEDSLGSRAEDLGKRYEQIKKTCHTLFEYKLYRSEIVEEKNIPRRLRNALRLSKAGNQFAKQYLKEKFGAKKRKFDPIAYLHQEFRKITGEAPFLADLSESLNCS